jgi:glycosyltransferase involved in cell wall biosynthesis
MKILFITDFYYPHIGGVEKLFESLATKLVEEGHQATFITLRYDQDLLKKEVQNGVEIIRISSLSRTIFSLIALPTIIKEARKADLIHTSTYSSAIGAWIASKLTGRKIVITVHEVWGKLWLDLPYLSKSTRILFMQFEKMLFRLKFDQYIAVSESTRSEIIKQGIQEQKVKTIYNGIDYNLPRWKEIAEPYTFTFFGRGGISKGLDLLIDAALELHKAHPLAKFKFIISPQSEWIFKTITGEIKNSELNSVSTLFSNLPHLQLLEELISSSCIIIPSYSEGFGFTATEASAMKIPIISSGKGSLSEVVSGKVITMKEFNSHSLVESMKDALQNKFEDIPERKFTIEEFINKHLALYDSL